jgi:Fe-S-cluster containining protein
MQITDPSDLLKEVGDEGLELIQKKYGRIKRFLKAGDTFKFTCDKSGRCCKNRFTDPIILSPYDVLRLRKNLNIATIEFLQEHGHLVLGSDSRLPLVLLKYQWDSPIRNQCSFLKDNQCSVYEDRPLRCRLYPLGRIRGAGDKSFYFLTDGVSYCNFGKGQEHKIEDWLEESGLEPYFKHGDKLFDFFFKMDHEKYRSLDDRLKFRLGSILYDFDSVIEAECKAGALKRPESDDEVMDVIYAGLEEFVEKVAGYKTLKA